MHPTRSLASVFPCDPPAHARRAAQSPSRTSDAQTAPRRLPVPNRLGIAGALILALLVASPAAAQLEARALLGDVAPGTGGGTYSFFEHLATSSQGDVVFLASITGGTASWGIFVETATESRVIVLSGDAAPIGVGGSFGSLFEPAVNAAGDVAFGASIVGGSASAGLFRSSGGVITPVLLSGDPAPGPAGGTFNYIGTPPALNDAGDIAFFSGLGGGATRLAGLFRFSGGSLSSIVYRGDPSPAGLPGSLSILYSRPAINQAGEVGYIASMNDGGTSYGAILLHSGGSNHVVAVTGDVPLGSGGGAYSGFETDRFAVTGTGSVVFAGRLSTTQTAIHVFEDEVGAAGSVRVLHGDPAPDTAGGTIFNPTRPAANAAGDLVFSSAVLGGSVPVGVFEDQAGSLEAVALPGDPAPQTSGALANFNAYPQIADNGQIAFIAAVGGTPGSGIFTVPEPGLALPIAIGALALAATGRRRPNRPRGAARARAPFASTPRSSSPSRPALPA
ncbi:MAG: hypothetical protein R3F21_03230 [Myxococcota bacterium]